MMVEKPRTEFLKMLAEDSLPAGRWVAIVLAIPTEWLHERNLADDEVDRVISAGAKNLAAVGDGMYARIGWCSYFAVSRKPEDEIRARLARDMERAGAEMEECRLWRFSVEPISKMKAPVKLFTEMELNTNEEARKSEPP